MSMSDPLADAQAQRALNESSGALTVTHPTTESTVADVINRAAPQVQQLAQSAALRPAEPAKPALDADTIRAISDLAAAPGSADMASIREVMTNGRDLAQIVEGVALIAFRGRRAAGEGWRELCPALHKALMEAHFVATA